jgi:hypothetical protein
MYYDFLACNRQLIHISDYYVVSNTCLHNQSSDLEHQVIKPEKKKKLQLYLKYSTSDLN